MNMDMRKHIIVTTVADIAVFQKICISQNSANQFVKQITVLIE